jgi:hypothetical protein
MDFHETNFDASSYFFISKRLAKLRPNLVESQIVLAYKNHFPGMLWKTWPHYQIAKKKSEKMRWFAGLQQQNGSPSQLQPFENGENNSIRGQVNRRMQSVQDQTQRGVTWLGWLLFPLITGISNGIVYVLQSLGVLPMIYQKVIVRIFQTSILSGVTLLWYWAMKHPAAFSAIVILILLLAGLIFIKFCVNPKDLAMEENKEQTLAGEAHDEPDFSSPMGVIDSTDGNHGKDLFDQPAFMAASPFNTMKRPGTAGSERLRRGDTVKPFIGDIHQIINDHAAADIAIESISRQVSHAGTPIKRPGSAKILQL